MSDIEGRSDVSEGFHYGVKQIEIGDSIALDFACARSGAMPGYQDEVRAAFRRTPAAGSGKG